WPRPDRWRRMVVDSALWAVEAATAIVVFRSFDPGGMGDADTWGALALAVLVGVIVRGGADAGTSLLDGVTVQRSDLSTRIADLGALGTGLVVGIGAVGLAAFAEWGASVAVVGMVALATEELLGIRSKRHSDDANQLADAQEAVVAGVADATVLQRASEAVLSMLDARAAVVSHSSGALLAVSSGVRTTPSCAIGPVIAQRAAGASSFLAAPDELSELRAIGDLEDGPLFVLSATVTSGVGDVTVVALRREADRSFSLGNRRLLQRLAPMVATAVEASDRLTRFQRQARFDELTGLPNRASIEASIVEVMAEVRPLERSMAVMLVDLNGFKAVNDTLGHQTGDVVLAEIGRRIGAAASAVDAVGRLGGDEFVVVVSNQDREALVSQVEEVSDELASVVGERIVHGDLVLDIGISVGMAVFPDHGDTPGELLRAADVAMYAAKAKGVHLLAYEGRLDRHRTRRLGLATDLRAALAAEQLEVFFQPKVAFEDGSLVGAEALIRWTHPTLHSVPAGEIVDVAEHAGLLCDLTDFVLDRAARQVVALRAVDCDVPIAVNLTERDIADQNLPDRYRRAIDAYGLDPGAITLEVTETALLTREVESLGVLPKMSEMGVTLAIDDFGTGFSSLSHLRRFPVDEIKIDMSFVERMVIRPNDAVIVRSIVELGHSLGLRVVAEGVETNESWNLLEEFGVDVAQGNHVMKAIDGDSFASWAPFWDRHRVARGSVSTPRLNAVPAVPDLVEDVTVEERAAQER
ncbi:MAG: EAL domain-containing protein, partial [Acidimicrobiales bacterium]|nr:EAL domain-containing protein [Acidimicrobiales bacterium]